MPLGKGAKKAMRAMRARYGVQKGTRVFYAKKNKYAPSRRVSDSTYYKRGFKQGKVRRRG